MTRWLTIDWLGNDLDQAFSGVGEGEVPELGGGEGQVIGRGAPLIIDIVTINPAFLLADHKEKQLLPQLCKVKGHLGRSRVADDLGQEVHTLHFELSHKCHTSPGPLAGTRTHPLYPKHQATRHTSPPCRW